MLELSFTDIDPNQLKRMCIFLTLDTQLMKENMRKDLEN